MLHWLVSYSLGISNLFDKSYLCPVLYSPKQRISFFTVLAATMMNAESGRAAKCKSENSTTTSTNADGKNPRITI